MEPSHDHGSAGTAPIHEPGGGMMNFAAWKISAPERPEHYADDTAGFIARSQEEGLSVVYPADNELQVDIDGGAHSACFDAVFPVFAAELGASIVRRAPSKSGPPGEHITIILPFDVDDATRVTLQAILGSDGKREMFGWLRLQRGIQPVSIFVEKPA